jgi:hypothetical protein
MQFDNNGKPGKPGDAYISLLYRIEGDTMYLSAPDAQLIGSAIRAGDLAGEIQGESVLITAEPAALDAFMAEHAAELFKPTDLALRRVD